MHRKRLTSWLYLASVVVTCGSIGAGTPLGADVAAATQSNQANTAAPNAAPANAAVVPAAEEIAAQEPAPSFDEIGVASWYGEYHQGRLTASGEVFDQNELTAAHRTLPLDTMARVTNLENGRSVEVRVNDRGPYVGGRVIDLSARAADDLGMLHQGLAVVRVEVLPDETQSSALD